MTETVKEGQLYRECSEKVKFPRIIRVKRLREMGSISYVFFVAENQAAMSVHPNGGFMPLSSFPAEWTPYAGN